MLSSFSQSHDNTIVAMNGLYDNNSQHSWNDDGSEGTLKVEDDCVILESANQGSPFSVYCDTTTTKADNSSNFFEATIRVLEGSISVGVVQKNAVEPGWKTRGMFYNGNLTNGIAALRTAFGPYLKVGHTAGVLFESSCSEEEKTTRVYLYVDGDCLGLAFDITRPCSEEEMWLPCLHVTGRAVVRFAVPESIPTERFRAAPKRSKDEPYVGEWKMEKLLAGPELGAIPIPDGHPCTASVNVLDGGEARTYRLQFNICNRISFQFGLTGERREGFDLVKSVTPGMSTMMMPPPSLEKIEHALTQGVTSLARIFCPPPPEDEVDETDMILVAPTLELHLKPYTKTYSPVTDIS